MWYAHYGEAGSGICGLCNVKKLIAYEGDWEISHIIAKKHKGPLIMPNLRPLCRTCNRTVGADSLYYYARMFPGACERLRLTDFMKQVPVNDPTRFQERLDCEQLEFLMRQQDLRYEHEHGEKAKLLAQREKDLSEREEKYEEQIILLKEKEKLVSEKEKLVEEEREVLQKQKKAL